MLLVSIRTPTQDHLSLRRDAVNCTRYWRFVHQIGHDNDYANAHGSSVASGLLGRDIVKAFDRDLWRVVGTGLSRVNPPSVVKLDLQDHKSIRQVLDEVQYVK
jgi:hypothetical protein